MPFSKNRLIIGAVLVAAIASITLFWVNGKATDREKKVPRYREVTVKLGTYQDIVTADGAVKPINRIEIKSKASGEIVALPVEEGDFVRKGDLLARLDQKDEVSAVAQAQADMGIAKAEFKQAQRMFNRRDQLYRKKIISEEERDEIGLKLAVAKGKVIQTSTVLDRAKERLSESIVRAPIDGIILQKYVEEGQIIVSGLSNVSGGTLIIDIAAMHSVYIEAGVNEIDIGKIEIGQRATVVAEAYPQLKFQGKIIRIAPEAKVEQNVTLFDVIVEVENTDGKLKSGMNAQAEISINMRENVLLVPLVAVQNLNGAAGGPGEGTVRLKEGSDFVSHKVRVGLFNFKEAEILSGLSEGDILGLPMTSRLKADNERIEKLIKRSRSFGGGKKK